MTPRKQLPLTERYGLDREEAAAYVGYSPNVFDRMVDVGEMPKPHKSAVSTRLVWPRSELEEALRRLPTGEIEVSEYAGVDL